MSVPSLPFCRAFQGPRGPVAMVSDRSADMELTPPILARGRLVYVGKDSDGNHREVDMEACDLLAVQWTPADYDGCETWGDEHLLFDQKSGFFVVEKITVYQSPPPCAWHWYRLAAPLLAAEWLYYAGILACRLWPELLIAYPYLAELVPIAIEKRFLYSDGWHPSHGEREARGAETDAERKERGLKLWNAGKTWAQVAAALGDPAEAAAAVKSEIRRFADKENRRIRKGNPGSKKRNESN